MILLLPVSPKQDFCFTDSPKLEGLMRAGFGSTVIWRLICLAQEGAMFHFGVGGTHVWSA